MISEIRFINEPNTHNIWLSCNNSKTILMDKIYCRTEGEKTI